MIDLTTSMIEGYQVSHYLTLWSENIQNTDKRNNTIVYRTKVRKGPQTRS
jgi:hypothetical protein